MSVAASGGGNLYLFTYAHFKHCSSIQPTIRRKLQEPLHGRLPGFRLTATYPGGPTVIHKDESTVPGIVWQDLTEKDFKRLDTYITDNWMREQHKILIMPEFPFEHEMYIIVDAWVYLDVRVYLQPWLFV